MNFDLIKQNLRRFVLSEAVWFDSIGSTNDFLKQKSPGCLAAARVQTSGKGTRGRSFESADGGLYFSFVAEDAAAKNALVTPAAAVAVSTAVEKLTGLDTKIKWVNDVYVGGKKLSGILCEKTPLGIVVGIGINLENQISGTLSEIAVSVAQAGGKVPKKEDLIVEILDGFAAAMADETNSFMTTYRAKNLLLGKTVEYTVNNVQNVGVATDVLLDGRLEIDKHVILSSGDVRIKSA